MVRISLLSTVSELHHRYNFILTPAKLEDLILDAIRLTLDERELLPVEGKEQE